MDASRRFYTLNIHIRQLGDHTSMSPYSFARSRAVPLLLAVFLALTASGCKLFGSNSDNSSTPAAAPAPAPTFNPVTVFNQTIAATDGDWTPFPGQANYWDIDSDFSLSDGYDDQCDGCLNMTVGGTDFPFDQDYSELTFSSPTMGSADGVIAATVTDGNDSDAYVINDTYSGALGPISNARLQQTLNLTAATGTVSLSWNDDWNLNTGNMANEPDPVYQVVLRDTSGNLLETLFDTDGNGTQGSADLTAYAGSSVVLSFERNGPAYADYVVVDDVSVTDGGAVEYVTNGDFETGDLTGWTANSPSERQNMTSGVRNLEGLDVTRSFYTVPNKKWGRWVDVFENNTGAPISTTVTYYSNLGSDNYGIIYYTPNTGNQALTTWDGGTGDRDVGFVFGNATTVDFTSDDGIGNGNGSDGITHTYDITVPAGGRVAIVNFMIMNGTDTGSTAVDITDLATDIDTEAKLIVDNFWTDGQYRAGMTQAQINAIENF
jgi:hypothetical protein